MYSIVPFTIGAVIAVGILSAFAPMGIVSISDSPAIAQAAPPGIAPVGPAPAGTGGPGDIRGGGSSDSSTGPNRPNANIADGGDAHRQIQDKRLQQRQRNQADPSRDLPAGK
ncbi:MAG: hypothetical protein ACYC1L_03085 [Alphaproteobacteria bacterium]